jgi:ABC-type Mn2+/Zn2+ transport system ATPase subunit
MDSPQDLGLAPRAFSPLVVEALCVERGRRLVLENVGFTLTSGESLRVTGRNGAGISLMPTACAPR